eukprot:5632999-Amphidinium_carterae.1
MEDQQKLVLGRTMLLAQLWTLARASLPLAAQQHSLAKRAPCCDLGLGAGIAVVGRLLLVHCTVAPRLSIAPAFDV